jgi:hypothetical protein
MFCPAVGSNNLFHAPRDKPSVESFAGAACLSPVLARHAIEQIAPGVKTRSKAAPPRPRVPPRPDYLLWYGAFRERSVGPFGERGPGGCAGASTILACEGSPAAGFTVSTSPPRLRTILAATVKHMVRYGFSPSSTRTSRLSRRSLRPFFAGGKPRFCSIDSACD